MDGSVGQENGAETVHVGANPFHPALSVVSHMNANAYWVGSNNNTWNKVTYLM